MLLPILLTLAAAAPPTQAPLPKLKHPIAVIAHRGGKALAPENTLTALRNAIRLGVDYVEIDVRTTRDGHLVLMHDRTVDRTTDGAGAVKDLDFAAIRRLDAGRKFAAQYAGERVPTLDEALALCKGKVHIYLDHKEAPTAQALAAIQKYKMEKQVVVYNGVEGLREWKRLAPQIPVMPSLPDEYQREGGIAEFLKTLPAEVLDGNLVEWMPEWVAQAHAAGVKVYVDNLGPNDNPEGFRKALAMSVDGIQTDHPDQLLAVLKEKAQEEKRTDNRRGRAFLALHDWSRFTRSAGSAPGEVILTSPELPTGLPADEIVVSWNAQSPVGTGLKIEARAFCDVPTRYYTLALWSPDGKAYPRESVRGQKDETGDVQTDMLALKQSASRVQLRVTLRPSSEGILPALTFLGVSLLDTRAALPALTPNRAAWGKELDVPGRPQSGYPGASGWCSPTSTTMVLAYWSNKLQRPELNLSVPEVAHAIYDKVYDGTGNWPFNTAFAGRFPGLRAYVTRLSDTRQLEDWIAVGIPPIVSVSSRLIQEKPSGSDPGHLMVCIGFTENGDIVLNDPAHHPERGEVARKVFSRDRFVRAWKKSDFTVYLIYPEDARRPEDTYGHWESSENSVE